MRRHKVGSHLLQGLAIRPVHIQPEFRRQIVHTMIYGNVSFPVRGSDRLIEHFIRPILIEIILNSRVTLLGLRLSWFRRRGNIRFVTVIQTNRWHLSQRRLGSPRACLLSLATGQDERHQGAPDKEKATNYHQIILVSTHWAAVSPPR